MTTNAVLNLVSASLGDKLLDQARIEMVDESVLLVFKRQRPVDHFADFLLKNAEVMQLEGLLQNPLCFFEHLDPACFQVADLPEHNARMAGLGGARNVAISHDDAVAIAARVESLPVSGAEVRSEWKTCFPGFDYDPSEELEKARAAMLRWMGMISERRIGVLRIRG